MTAVKAVGMPMLGGYRQGMGRIAMAAAAAACALLAAACTGTSRPLPVPATGGASAAPSGAAGDGIPASPPPVPGVTYVSGGCGATPLLAGKAPSWAMSANPPTQLRYALASDGGVAAFLFGYPLMARNPRPYSDKILWIVKYPRHGLPLRITGRPLAATSPVVSSTWSADAAPGEIYPSEVVVPTAGCWQFTLAWNGHKDAIDLRYVTRR